MLETTGPERTLVEGFRRPALSGGLEELVRSASAFPTLDLGLLGKVLRVGGAVQRGLYQYDLRTSKNFFNPRGFRKQEGSKPWNVGYYDDFGNWYDERDKRLAAGSDDYYQNIANLQYDPRPPVIVTDGKTNYALFYIDLNRNGMFDRNAA